jgi:hypothetical protein
MTTNKQDRPAFRPLPELEHIADPGMVSLRNKNSPPTTAQRLARRRGGLLMKLGGVSVQLRHIIAETSDLALEPIETPNFECLDSMISLLDSLNTKLRKQWGYKELSTFESLLKEFDDDNS